MTPIQRRDAVDAPTPLHPEALSGRIGVTVTGLHLDPDRLTRCADELRRLVMRHHLVVLTGVDATEEQFTALASAFGPQSVHPLQQMVGRSRTVSVIEDSASRPPAGFPWHTDLSWLERPPRFGFLQALDVPERGGDTLWVSLGAVHSALSPTMRDFVAGLRGVHRIDDQFADSVVRLHGRDVADRLRLKHPPVSHPLVRTHPDTGAATLFHSPLYVDEIEGLHGGESASVLDHLAALIEDPNHAIRWRWSVGDIAIWDESCTVHRALTDHHPLGRRMRRCTTAGGPVTSWRWGGQRVA